MADSRQLSWRLAWAVVFCDIGTSVYYVPGILYEGVGDLAALFVLLTTGGFVLLSLKYAEIAWRNPEGGGVVTVATKAFGPRWGALGGMLITVDYFLTSSISSISGFHYLSTLFPAFLHHIPLLACAGLGMLAIVNIIGIRESATLAFGMAAAALTVDLVVAGAAAVQMTPADWERLTSSLTSVRGLSPRQVAIGFAGAWLAFSGLESISQLSPAMREPLSRTARAAMIAVIVTILITSPVLTGLSVSLLSPEAKSHNSERFISLLGGSTSGWPLELAVGMTAAALLLFAANTAIIGGYHVFLALAERGFMPGAVLQRSARFNTPHIAIVVATLVPVGIIWATGGKLTLLGDMYAFGLLGAFTLSSLGLDVIRWRLRRRGPVFWLGVLTSLLVCGAWGINLVEKQVATLFGGGLTLVLMLISIANQQSWIADAVYGIPIVQRLAARSVAAAERLAEDVRNMVTLGQALELTALYPSSTLVAVRGRNASLIREAATRAKGRGENAIYCIFVEERPGLFTGSVPSEPNEEGKNTLVSAVADAARHGIEVIPIWTVSHNAAEAIARAAEALGVDAVMMGVSRRSALYHLLRGHVINGLARRLPKNCHLVLCN
jgi:amino acid transporter/nucleotide-binding universal stress UspA family protein